MTSGKDILRLDLSVVSRPRYTFVVRAICRFDCNHWTDWSELVSPEQEFDPGHAMSERTELESNKDKG